MSESEGSERDNDLWRYIPIGEYAKPELPASDLLKDQMQPVWQYIKNTRFLKNVIDWLLRQWRQPHGNSKSDSAQSKNLVQLPPELLDRVTPKPHWKAASKAMHQMLRDWAADGVENERKEGRMRWQRIVLDPPFCGTREIMEHLAAEQGWPIVEAPSPEDILNGGKEWVSDVASKEGSPLVIPCLERCYLRHYNGLSLIQELIDWLITSNRHCLIGCGSWAWAYFKAALNLGPLFPQPYILDALSGKDLKKWLALPLRGAEEERLVFRRSNNDRKILLSMNNGEVDENSRDSESVDNAFFETLAAYSLGNPGVARAVWRKLLRVAAEESGRDADAGASEGEERTIWVSPLSEQDLPGLPPTRARSQFFVLHTILLHGSLPPEVLREVLSISTIDVLETLHHLHHSGLLEIDMDLLEWKIASAGYPAIRRELDRAGYLADQT